MRHNLTLEGHAFRLRPIEDADASFIIELRCDPNLNRWINRTSPKLDDQLTWLSAYYNRPGDYYFVVERIETGERVGLVAIYDIAEKMTGGEWGRWIIKPGSLAAPESALLIYRCAFDLLGLQWVRSRTVQDNKEAVSFHDSCGIHYKRLLTNYVVLDNKSRNSVQHCVTANEWPRIRERLDEIVMQAAEMVGRV